MISKIREALREIEELSKKKTLKIISHHDTDGITAAAIFSRAMQRWNKKFSLQIVRGLEQDFIENLPNDAVLIFLDLASGSLNYLSQKKTEVFVFDHHEIIQEIPPNVRMINPVYEKEENISGAAIAYLVAKEISDQNRDLATLAVIGMVGDSLDKNRAKIYDSILKDADVTIKTGPLLYPATRPLDKVLEYSSSLYIPGVTGSFSGTLQLLKEAGLEKGSLGFKSLIELTDDEMSKLVTSIMLRRLGENSSTDIIGSLFLTKFFNKIEDARELSALINACSRMDSPEVSLAFCLGNKNARREAEKIYTQYRQSISAALKYIEEVEKITGKNYTIINARDKVKDTIIGTAASIMSYSPLYPEGTIIIAMAYNEDKIKVSARLVGKKGRNVREILTKATIPLAGEVGGHPEAAGCLISKANEEDFIVRLKDILEIDVVKV